MLLQLATAVHVLDTFYRLCRAARACAHPPVRPARCAGWDFDITCLAPAHALTSHGRAVGPLPACLQAEEGEQLQSVDEERDVVVRALEYNSWADVTDSGGWGAQSREGGSAC